MKHLVPSDRGTPHSFWGNFTMVMNDQSVLNRMMVMKFQSVLNRMMVMKYQ